MKFWENPRAPNTMTLDRLNPNTLNVYCDGGARGNPGPAAIGFLVKDEKGNTIHRFAEKIGESTNNIAEYRAVIAVLEWIVKHKANILDKIQVYNIYLDSRLVTNQLNGKFKVKNPKLRVLLIKVRKLERKANLVSTQEQSLFSSNYSKIIYNLIPREQNSEADALLNQALNS